VIVEAADFRFDAYQAGKYGDHCIIHGDCRLVLPKIPDKAIGMIMTDPPYGHNNNNGDLIANREKVFGGGQNVGKARPIDNDGIEAENLFDFLVSETPRLLERGGCCCCCCCGGGPDPMFARWALKLDHLLDFKQMVVWDKGPMGMGHHYRRSYETVLVAMKRGGACKWYDNSKRIENIIRPGDYGISKIIPQADDHPTVKPVELFQHFIRLHSQPLEIILDPFMGSGTGLVACKNLGRRGIGIETSMEHCLHAEQRLAQEVLDLPVGVSR